MKSFRPERVAHIVRAVVSDAISHKLSDPRIEPLSSVTRVEVSRDLEHAKVFVSVMGDASTRRRTMAGLHSAAGVVQRLVARQLPIRHCPQLRFLLDESIQRAVETIQLIDETMAEYGEPDVPGAPSDQDENADGSPGEVA